MNTLSILLLFFVAFINLSFAEVDITSTFEKKKSYLIKIQDEKIARDRFAKDCVTNATDGNELNICIASIRKQTLRGIKKRLKK